jgi:hypothetical protein
MKWEIGHTKTRLYLITAIILLVGLGSALFIYLTAGSESGSVLGYEGTGGDVYTIRPEDSKIYRHDLEVYGGKANVLMDEFMRWFAGLWHGKSLALTLAFITIFISLVFFVVAYHWPSDLNANTGDGRRQ